MMKKFLTELAQAAVATALFFGPLIYWMYHHGI
jgi:hypothetical protein